MKRKLCFLFVLPLLFAACENVLPIEEVDLSSMVAEFTTPTKTVTFEGHVVDMEYLVTSADLETYLELQPNSPNGIKRPVKSVEAKGPNADVTLMYVVNYDKGWEILSADKRAQPVLAFSDGGEFSFETANPGERVWLEGLACDVLNLRTADKALQSRAAENNPNVGFWRGLEVRKKMMEEELAMMTRFEIPDSIDWPFEPRPDRPIIPSLPEGGHYEWFLTEQIEVLDVEVPHLIETHWRQREPWNVKCPTCDNGSSNVLVGCVAVAASQMLYYLHDKIGIPTMAPTDAYFSSEYIPNTLAQNYEFNLVGMSSGVWGSMDLTASGTTSTVGTDYVASLMAHVGWLVNMRYGPSESSASTSSLPATVYATYGIDSEYIGTYDDNTRELIIESLGNGFPVTTRAVDSISGRGHSFIIDGYQEYVYAKRHRYEWVWDVPPDPNGPQIKVPLKTEIVKTNRIASRFVCMNWGWGNGYDSENNEPVWYALTGDWDVSSYNYSVARGVILGYTPIE